MNKNEIEALKMKVNLLENNNRILTQKLKDKDKEIKELTRLYQKEKEAAQKLKSRNKQQDKFNF